jgi:hypothetical protein
MDTGFNTIEFYSGDISGNFATASTSSAAGGAQDNAPSVAGFSGYPTGPVQWQLVTGGDGFYARIDPVGNGVNPRYFVGNNSGGMSRCTATTCLTSGASYSSVRGSWTGDTQSFTLPFDLFHGGVPGGDDCAAAGVPGGCGHLVAGTTRVWETVAGGNATMNSASWYVTNNPSTQNMTKASLGNRSFINQVKYSPKYSSNAIVGTNDANVWIGFNLGTGVAGQANWVNITGGNTVLPNRPVLGIALDPSSASASLPTGYAAVGGFNANTPGMPGHLFRVDCTAASCSSFTWADKTGNLPDIPVDSVIVNPRYPQQVYAGTDFGVFYTNDITAASPTWYRFTNGLPSAMIWDMQIDRGSTTLSVWTRGRGAYVWQLPDSPVLTVTVNSSSVQGTTPNLTNLPANDQAISYSPSTESGNVTGTLTCSTTATSSSPVGTYPISNCSGLSDAGLTVVYNYTGSNHRVVNTPVTTASLSPSSPTGANGWYLSGPTVTLSAVSGGLPVASTHYAIDGGPEQTYTAPFAVTAEGSHTVSFYSTDSAGHSETPHSIIVRVDLNTPTSSATITPPAQNGWYASPTVTLSGDDGAGSGIDHISYSLDGGPFTTYAGPLSGFSTGNHFIQFKATDVAGRAEPSLNTIAFKADAVLPSVTITRPKVGGDYKLGQVVKANFKCADKQSGLASCVGTVPKGSAIDTSTVGDHTFTVTGTDRAGNTRTVNRSYHVHYAWQGFFKPVTNTSSSKLNLVHAGDLIRLSFGLHGNRGTGIFAGGFPTSVAISCPAWPLHSIHAAPGSAGLSYVPASGHYQYGWQTNSAWAGTCRRFQLQLNDGTGLHTADFMFFA